MAPTSGCISRASINVPPTGRGCDEWVRVLNEKDKKIQRLYATIGRKNIEIDAEKCTREALEKKLNKYVVHCRETAQNNVLLRNELARFEMPKKDGVKKHRSAKTIYGKKDKNNRKKPKLTRKQLKHGYERAVKEVLALLTKVALVQQESEKKERTIHQLNLDKRTAKRNLNAVSRKLRAMATENVQLRRDKQQLQLLLQEKNTENRMINNTANNVLSEAIITVNDCTNADNRENDNMTAVAADGSHMEGLQGNNTSL